MKEHSFIDNLPPQKSQIKAWNMRPRIKEKEIGPNFRFAQKNQMERIYDTVVNRKSSLFRDEEIRDT